MKKFVALLLSTLTIIATLFALSGCSSHSEYKTRKQWIRYYFEEFTEQTIEKNDTEYTDEGTKFDFKIKELTKFDGSAFYQKIIYEKTYNSYYLIIKAYQVNATRYSTFGNITKYDLIAYIGTIECRHCSGSSKFCKKCVKLITFENEYENIDTVFFDKDYKKR